jgi:hypothetical protein
MRSRASELQTNLLEATSHPCHSDRRPIEVCLPPLLQTMT